MPDDNHKTPSWIEKIRELMHVKQSPPRRFSSIRPLSNNESRNYQVPLANIKGISINRSKRLIIFLCLLPLIGLIAMVASHYLEHGWSDLHIFLREIAFACLIATVAIVTIGFAEKEERDKAFEEEREQRKQDYEDLETNITKNVDLLESS